MDNIEKLLNENKNDLDRLKIPKDMESRLRNTLDNAPNKNRKTNMRVKIAALIIAVMIIGYNVDTFAYYAKQLIGYENIMGGTLRELNKLGKGQIIDKSYTLGNGVVVTLDGVMLDDNNLVTFYSIKDPLGNMDYSENHLNINIEDQFGKSYNRTGTGQINKDKTEMNWVMTCRAPGFFKKSMKLKVYSTNMDEIGEIKFKLDRNKALGSSIEIRIDKEIEIDKTKIKIESLMISPMSTRLKGQFENLSQAQTDYIQGEGFVDVFELAVIADEKEVNLTGRNMLNSQGNVFYDALPIDLNDIEIKLISLGESYNINKKIEITKGHRDIDISTPEVNVTINKAYELEGNTFIDITTDKSLILNKVFLDIDGRIVPAEESTSVRSFRVFENGKYVDKYTRAVKFNGIGEKLELDIQSVRYKKIYDKIIYKDTVR